MARLQKAPPPTNHSSATHASSTPPKSSLTTRQRFYRCLRALICCNPNSSVSTDNVPRTSPRSKHHTKSKGPLSTTTASSYQRIDSISQNISSRNHSTKTKPLPNTSMRSPPHQNVSHSVPRRSAPTAIDPQAFNLWAAAHHISVHPLVSSLIEAGEYCGVVTEQYRTYWKLLHRVSDHAGYVAGPERCIRCWRTMVRGQANSAAYPTFRQVGMVREGEGTMRQGASHFLVE